MSWQEINGIQTEAEAKRNAEQLPAWVKCMYCGERPKRDDYLGEVIKGSTALAHQSCMKQRGKVFGMNIGTLQEIGGSIKPPEETGNDIPTGN